MRWEAIREISWNNLRQWFAWQGLCSLSILADNLQQFVTRLYNRILSFLVNRECKTFSCVLHSTTYGDLKYCRMIHSYRMFHLKIICSFRCLLLYKYRHRLSKVNNSLSTYCRSIKYFNSKFNGFAIKYIRITYLEYVLVGTIYPKCERYPLYNHLWLISY